jgi:hypothetical protein
MSLYYGVGGIGSTLAIVGACEWEFEMPRRQPNRQSALADQPSCADMLFTGSGESFDV